MALFLVLSVLCGIILFLYQFSKRKYSYWKNQKVPYIEPLPIVGNFRDYILLREFPGYTEQKICQTFPNEPYVGAYYGTEPTLIVQSPEILKLITTKDFYYFSSREISKYTHNEVFTSNIFFTYGDRWRVLRQNFTQLFSSAKLRNMFHLIEKCAHVYQNLLDEETAVTNAVDIRSLNTRFTMDCVGSCSFGIDTNTMGKNQENNPFRRMGDLVFEISNARAFSLIGRSIWPAIFYFLRQKVFSVELDKFFNNLLTSVLQARNYEPSSRNDFVDLVMNMKKQKYLTGDSILNSKDKDINKKISIEADDKVLTGQCLTFFAAGFETSASSLSFAMYELAKNQAAQEKAFKEVEEYLRRHENHLTYDCVTELPYLQACFDEALRLYPIAGFLTREVVENYVLPCGAVLEPGIRVHMPVYHMHHSPDNFPEPESYIPERFLPENRHNIKPYTFMPFGEGPRLCIGMRFAKMQAMAGMVTVLKKYRLELEPGTPRQLELEPVALVTQPKELIRLRLIPREGWEQRVFRPSDKLKAES